MPKKQEVYNVCLSLVNEKITIADKAMKEAQESANAEEKSTAGDKHDTARAMSHIERDMYAKQLTEATQLLKILKGISPDKTTNTIESGSLVRLSNGIFYIAVALGKIAVNDESIFVISPLSPLGQALLGKKSGDSFSFNDRQIAIEAVE